MKTDTPSQQPIFNFEDFTSAPDNFSGILLNFHELICFKIEQILNADLQQFSYRQEIIDTAKGVLPIIRSLKSLKITYYDEAQQEAKLDFQVDFDPALPENEHRYKITREAINWVIKNVIIGNPADPSGLVNNLYPNSSHIEMTVHFPINRMFADRITATMKQITNKIEVAQHYNPSRKSTKIECGTAKYDVISEKGDKIVAKGKPRIIELSLDDPHVRLRTFEAFYEHILKIRDAKVIKIVCALFDFCADQNTWYLRDISLNDFMKRILAEPKSGYFNKKEKQSVSDILLFLSQLTVEMDTEISFGKTKRIQSNRYRVLDIDVAQYGKTREGEVDRTIIVRFHAELLPKFNKGTFPARLYGRGILNMDANHDRNCILLSFYLQTRLSQINQNKRANERLAPCRMQRGELIEYLELEKTNRSNPHVANDVIKRILDKIIQQGQISNYDPKPLPLSDIDFINFYPNASVIKEHFDGTERLYPLPLLNRISIGQNTLFDISEKTQKS